MDQRRRGFLRQARQPQAQARRVPLHRRPAGCHQPLRQRSQPEPEALPLDQGPGRDHRRRQARAPSVGLAPLAAGAPAFRSGSPSVPLHPGRHAPSQRRIQLLPDQLFNEPARGPECPPRSGQTRRPAQTASCRSRPSSCCPVGWCGLRRRSNAGKDSLNKPDTKPPTYFHHTATAPMV